MEKFSQLWAWFEVRADHTAAKMWLIILSFTESCVFIIPPDPLLAAMVVARKNRVVYYTALTVLASVAGAAFGYFVGMFLFTVIGEPIVSFYGMADEFARAQSLFVKGVFVVTLMLAVTPIPFKIAVLSAGVVHAPFIPFIIAAIIGRGVRYVLVAALAYFFGSRALELAKRYTIPAAILGVAVILVYYVFL